MRAQPPESLSEFDPEDRGTAASERPGGETGEFTFDGDADRRPKVAVSESLIDVVAAASPADTPQVPLSRIESRQARRRASHLKRLARRAGALSSRVMASIVSAMVVLRRLKQLDLVGALKAPE